MRFSEKWEGQTILGSDSSELSLSFLFDEDDAFLTCLGSGSLSLSDETVVGQCCLSNILDFRAHLQFSISSSYAASASQDFWVPSLISFVAKGCRIGTAHRIMFSVTCERACSFCLLREPVPIRLPHFTETTPLIHNYSTLIHAPQCIEMTRHLKIKCLVHPFSTTL